MRIDAPWINLEKHTPARNWLLNFGPAPKVALFLFCYFRFINEIVRPAFLYPSWIALSLKSWNLARANDDLFLSESYAPTCLSLHEYSDKHVYALSFIEINLMQNIAMKRLNSDHQLNEMQSCEICHPSDSRCCF